MSAIDTLRWYGWEVNSEGCWEWPQDKLSGDGYGRLTLKGRSTRAHRFAWETWVGPLGSEELLLHSCDNRRCINPEHLRVGTYKDNVDDMFQRGRANKARGEGHGNTSLTRAEVEHIRELYAEGTQQSLIAQELGLRKQTVNNIVLRRTWK